MADPFDLNPEFHYLSLKDLLDARDTYHVHLTRMRNVISTAVGLYRIRHSDIDASGRPIPGEDASKVNSASGLQGKSSVRTLSNSKVVPGFSWPCVLVFVKEWEEPNAFHGDPTNFVPKRLYMADGRMIPVCVVQAEMLDRSILSAAPSSQKVSLFAGGYPVYSDVQGAQHAGTVSCLVSNGDVIYALTNRHVTGSAGRKIFSFARGNRFDLGFSDDKQVGKVPFAEIFPGWPGTRSYTNVDAGLIHISDVRFWTAQVFGIGELADPVDIGVDTLNLNVIGTKVRSHSGISGALDGEVQALFYRYQTTGGYDYIADVLIGPSDGKTPLNAHQGDSGALWVVEGKTKEEESKSYHPLAIQWGSHRLTGEGKSEIGNYALCSFVSTVLRVLDVQLVRDLNIGLEETWGKTGHFKVAAKACELVENPKLKTLLLANQDRIGVTDEDLEQGDVATDHHAFVPLADVADLVWRTTRPSDESNHFADMDFEPTSGVFKNKSLLKLCESAANVSAKVWNKYYASIGEDDKRGALPFRIWQMFDLMVEAAKQQDVTAFVCLGGLMSHYAGDACQPLHVSQFHHGRDASEKNVHGDYETKMLDRFAGELFEKVNTILETTQVSADSNIQNGKGAAIATIGLMRETFEFLPPLTVVDAWVANAGHNRIAGLWNDVGDKTCEVIAKGCINLATLWASAWELGNGDTIPSSQLVAIDTDALKTLYLKKTFAPSMTLQDMEATGLYG